MTARGVLNSSPWRDLWSLPDDVLYLNHGSFGPSPKVVQDSFKHWTRQLESQPMNFLLREMEEALENSLAVLADFVGTSRGNLIFVDNATFGMNIVAASTCLEAGDEVLLTDHEYGAVTRLWRRTCQQTGARLVTQELPVCLSDRDAVAEQFMAGVTQQTRLIVVSHVTSPTALILPVEEICRRARTLDIPVCIDGPHAVGMLPLNLKKLDCDYYTASCHKWLSAPFGSGFLYVAPRQQKRIQPAIVSWGGSIGGRQPSWKDEFNWLGTRNPAAFLATADALRFLQSSVSSFPERIAADPEPLGDLTLLDEFRNIAHKLIDLAVTELGRSVGTKPLVKDTVAWCGSMISLALPAPSLPEADHVGKAGQRHPLQDWLWENHQIEIPVVRWRDQLLIRVSGHLYNSVDDIFTLSAALREYLN